MEETVYHFCTETFHMRDVDKEDVVAFTKGLFYKVVHTFERDGVKWFSYIDDRGRKHNLSKDFKKSIMIKVKDENVLQALETGNTLGFGTYYICRKTMRMKHDDSVAFKKGMVYECTDIEGDSDGTTWYMNSDECKGHQMTVKGMGKYLVKVIDKSVLEEQ